MFRAYVAPDRKEFQLFQLLVMPARIVRDRRPAQPSLAGPIGLRQGERVGPARRDNRHSGR